MIHNEIFAELRGPLPYLLRIEYTMDTFFDSAVPNFVNAHDFRGTNVRPVVSGPHDAWALNTRESLSADLVEHDRKLSISPLAPFIS